MDSIKKLLEIHDFIIADPKKISYENLQKLVGDKFIIKEQEISYIIKRSFDLQDLEEDPDSQVGETIYLKCSSGKEEFDEEDQKLLKNLGLFSFDRSGMELSSADGGGTFFSVKFEENMNAYIIEYPSTDDIYMNIKMTMEVEHEININDDIASSIADQLEEREIDPWMATSEQIKEIYDNI